MKTTLSLTLTLLTLIMFTFIPNSFAQDTAPEYVVRVIYFHPSDIEPPEDSGNALDTIIKDIQKFYADEMERHGYGRKTFKFETDENDQLIVHSIKGKFSNRHYNLNYYDTTSRIGAVETEINEKIDRTKNIIYLSWMDLYDPETSKHGIAAFGSGDSSKGKVLFLSTNFDFTNIERLTPIFNVTVGTVITHELGHAFGLNHDFRYDGYIMSYVGPQVSELSRCAAKWLDGHKYFNDTVTPINGNTVVRMLTSNYIESQEVFRLEFEITDPDGLHQAMLVTKAANGLIDCKELSGNNNIIEFDTTNITTDATNVSLAVMDSHGNFKAWKFNVSPNSFLHPKVVSIPDINLAKAVRKTLGFAPTTPITQIDMLKLRILENHEKPEKRQIPEDQITDLTGIEHALNLRYLLLPNNKISDISLIKTLVQLKYIYLERNHISDIRPITRLANLTTLHLGENPLIDLTPLTTLTQLKILSLNGNNISDISPLAGLTNLYRLSISYNQIKDVSSLAELVNLTELRLEGNPITDRKPLLELLEKNPKVKIYLERGGEPLPVTLSHFQAEHTNAGVVLKWTTESEVDNAGFYIYRSEAKEGEFKVVNPSMIQGAGTTGERSEYTWTDTTAKPNTVYYYRIEDVSHTGEREQLATVRLRGLISARGKLATQWVNLKKHQ